VALPGGVTSLDVTIRDVYADEVFALLRRFNTEHGTTVLFVTHKWPFRSAATGPSK